MCFRRRKAVVDLLSRNTDLQKDGVSLEREKLLVERLHVPKEWIHQAKVGSDISCEGTKARLLSVCMCVCVCVYGWFVMSYCL